MAEPAYFVSALVTGILLLGVWAFLARIEDWRRYQPASTLPQPDRGGDTGGSARSDDSTTAWIVGFLLLTLSVGGGAVLIVSDPSFAAGVGEWVAVSVAFGLMLLGFLLWGTYSSARHRGLPSAHAALLSAWLLGSLSVTAIAVKLVLTGG